MNKSLHKLLPVLFGFFVMGFCDVVGISTSYVQQDFGLSETLAGFIPSMVFIWFLLLSIPAALAMNRLGRKNMVQISNGITAIGMLIPFVHYNLATCMTAFVLLGIGNTILQVSLNPLLFAGSAAFALATVLISCRRPGRMAARVSPIEALRYTESAAGSAKKRARRRARRAEAGSPRNQSPPTAIAGGPRPAQSGPQAARGEPPLVAYRGALKPPTVDRVSDDAHVGVVVADVLCAGLLVLFSKALAVFPAGALVGMPLRNGRSMGFRVAPPAERDEVCRVIASAMGTEDDVVDLQPLRAVAEGAAVAVPLVDCAANAF